MGREKENSNKLWQVALAIFSAVVSALTVYFLPSNHEPAASQEPTTHYSIYTNFIQIDSWLLLVVGGFFGLIFLLGIIDWLLDFFDFFDF